MLLRAEPLITDKNVPIPNRDLRPSCSDPRFWRDHLAGLTVFLAEGTETVEYANREEVRGVDYLHSSDLAFRGSGVDYSEAWHLAERQAGTDASAAFFEQLVGRLLEREVQIVHILSWVDIAGAGNPSQYYGILTGWTPPA